MLSVAPWPEPPVPLLVPPAPVPVPPVLPALPPVPAFGAPQSGEGVATSHCGAGALSSPQLTAHTNAKTAGKSEDSKKRKVRMVNRIIGKV
jgi:hypothetical protein